MELYLKLPDAEISKMKNIIEQKDEVSCDVNKSFGTIWIRSINSETEFRFAFLGTIRCIISRVCFEHRRCGIMTSLLDEIKRICLENGVHTIVIQSVETEEMMKFCLKNGFKADQNASFVSEDGLLLGDYILSI